MKPGTPSLTAQRVAAYRVTFERVPAPFGDPEADERLSRDLAQSAEVDPGSDMARYLSARTTFFDRVVVNAIGRQVSQVVMLGAGYDGRALRFAHPEVRWFEVDHPDTQRDKRDRLARLGISTGDITYISLDFEERRLAAALLDAGYRVEAPSLFICEGVAVYLDAAVLESLLTDARSLATAGTRLAISLSVSRDVDGAAERREAFRATVGMLGEEARSTLTTNEAEGLFAATRWSPVELSDRARRAGFVVADPKWSPARSASAATRSRIGQFMERTFHRAATDDLQQHLERTYGIDISLMTRLDVGVYRVDRGSEPAWVARVFPAARPFEAAEHDAAVLTLLGERDFPAEHCADPSAVSSLEGQAVLVTNHVEGTSPGVDSTSLRSLGDLLGQLHSLSLDAREIPWEGGAWHHLSLAGSPSQEISDAVALLGDAEGRVSATERADYRRLRAELERADGGHGLPVTLLHPDFAPPNILKSVAHGTTIVDWTGAGRGPRVTSLGFLLWVAGWRDLKQVDAVMAGYNKHIQLGADELSRLAAVTRARPLVFESWAFCTGRKRLSDIADSLPDTLDRADAIAERVVHQRSAP
jgi:methyltransferase (TIGR00027 family)